MKYYTTTSNQCWDDVSYNVTGDEFNLSSIIEGQYDEALTEYVIIPKDTQLVIPEDITVEDLTIFKAPWD